MRNPVLQGSQVLYGGGLAAWLLTLLLAAAALLRYAPWPAYEWMLIALALLSLGAVVFWLQGSPFFRPAIGATALAYLVIHGARIYLYEVRPLLDVMSWPDALGGYLYVVWSWGRHELSRGSFAAGLGHLFREWFMLIIQLGVLAGTMVRNRR